MNFSCSFSNLNFAHLIKSLMISITVFMLIIYRTIRGLFLKVFKIKPVNIGWKIRISKYMNKDVLMEKTVVTATDGKRKIITSITLKEQNAIKIISVNEDSFVLIYTRIKRNLNNENQISFQSNLKTS